MGVVVRIEKLVRYLGVLVGFLVAADFAAQVAKHTGQGLRLARFFDANVKVNFPTGFKVFALFTGALGTYLVGRHLRQIGGRWARQWIFLAGVLAFLTLDEMAYIHQTVGFVLRENIKFRGALYFAWVVIWLPAAVIVVVVLWRFVLAMEPRIRNGYLVAGLLIGGGSGLGELLKGRIAAAAGYHETFGFNLASACSDSLEMIGLAVLIVTVARALAMTAGEVRLVIEEEASPVRPPGGSGGLTMPRTPR